MRSHHPLRPLAAVLALAAPALCAAQPVAPRPVAAPSAAPSPAQAAAPSAELPPLVRSMGQPPRWQPYASGVGTFAHGDYGAQAGALLGVHHPFASPVTGILGAAGEAYLLGGDETTGGARALAVVRAINLGLGVDWDARSGGVGFLASFNTAVRRGGLLGRGTMLRVDWSRARGDEIAVGLTVPLMQPWAGRTRPHHTGVWLDSVADARRGAVPRGGAAAAVPPPAVATAMPPAAEAALRDVSEAAGLLRGYTNFFSEQHESSRQKDVEATRALTRRVRALLAARGPRYPEGRNYLAVQRVYAAALGEAFGAAVGDTARGAAIASRARAGLLATVLLPYDAQFGRVKNRQGRLDPLFLLARDDFARWLADSGAVSGDARARALAVHARWLDVVEEVHRAQVKQWTDSRRLWLPLQLALQPEDHDTQAEIDALIERAIGRPFTTGNVVNYITSADLQLEFARSIVLARDYHVLWIHDFVGKRPDGKVDIVGFRQVADVYLPALTNAAARYDSAGRFPTYLIFLDQNFYEPADGRLWMTILEEPLDAKIALPAGHDSLAAVLRARQEALRRAVAGSRRLQADAARGGGADWLRKVVKVHVNITQPSDFTYRSHRILPPMPFLPDNLMRDHRKIAFYDLTEREPWRGALVLAGAGVGEQYASPTWQDRAIVVSGPAALEARAAVRRLLRLNGFRDRDVPVALRETAPAAVAGTAPEEDAPDARVAAADARDAAAPDTTGGQRALFVHNEPGFGRKEASVAKAMLYSLAPRGSVIIAPDPLWIGANWAGMLAGAALRGCRVFVIAPSLANSPSAGFPQMSRAADVLLRLLQVRQEFGDAMHAVGGELRVGIYDAHEDVNDVVRQMRETAAGVERTPWIRELFPFDPATLAAMKRATDSLEASGYRPHALGSDVKERLPQIHQKTQLVADGATLARLLRRPELADVLALGVRVRARQSSASPDLRGAAYMRAELLQPAAAVFRAYRAEYGMPPLSFYTTVGTQNQDDRGMMLDGEATMVLSGPRAALSLFDFYTILARSVWIEQEAQLDQLLPEVKGWKARLGRRIRFVL